MISNSYIFDLTQSGRTLLMKRICIFFGIVVSIIGIGNWNYKAESFMGQTQLLWAMGNFLVAYLLHRGFQSKAIQYYVVYSLVFMIFFSTFKILGTGRTILSLIDWIYIIPSVAYYLTGKRHGFIFSAIVFVSYLMVLIGYQNELGEHIKRVLGNAVSVYVFIWFLAHAYEGSRVKIQSALVDQAFEDPLTGVYNRRALKKKFDKLDNKRKKYVHLALVDVDHFKRLNDTYGHDAGDAALKELAALCIKLMGKDCVFRLGGEEFAILIPGDERHAFDLLDALRGEVEGHVIPFGDTQLAITVSAGIVNIDDKSSLSDILSQADRYMYFAKETGRNRVVNRTAMVDFN